MFQEVTTWYMCTDADVPLRDNMKSFTLFRRIARSYANSVRKEEEGGSSRPSGLCDHEDAVHPVARKLGDAGEASELYPIT